MIPVVMARIESLALSVARWAFVLFAGFWALLLLFYGITNWFVPTQRVLFEARWLSLPWGVLLAITAVHFVRPLRFRRTRSVKCPHCGTFGQSVLSPVNERNVPRIGWWIFGSIYSTLWVEGRRSLYDCSACGVSFEHRRSGQRLAFAWLVLFVASALFDFGCRAFLP